MEWFFTLWNPSTTRSRNLTWLTFKFFILWLVLGFGIVSLVLPFPKFPVIPAAVGSAVVFLLPFIVVSRLSRIWFWRELDFRRMFGIEPPNTTKDWERMRIVEQIVARTLMSEYLALVDVFKDQLKALKLSPDEFNSEGIEKALRRAEQFRQPVKQAKASASRAILLARRFGFSAKAPKRFFEDAAAQAKRELEAETHPKPQRGDIVKVGFPVKR